MDESTPAFAGGRESTITLTVSKFVHPVTLFESFNIYCVVVIGCTDKLL